MPDTGIFRYQCLPSTGPHTVSGSFRLLFHGLMEERWYPNEKFWKIAGEEGNTAVFGCDAHTPKAVWNPETEQKALQLAAKYGLKVQETVPMPKTF